MSDTEIIRPIPRPATSKKGDIITYYQDGDQEMRRYESSGVLQVWNGKRWAFAPGTAKFTYTAENASEIATNRWAEYERNAMLGLMDATRAASPNDAVRELAQIASKHAIAGGKGGSSYLQQVREMSGQVRGKQQVDDPVPPGSVRLTATVDIHTLREMLQARYDKDGD